MQDGGATTMLDLTPTLDAVSSVITRDVMNDLDRAALSAGFVLRLQLEAHHDTALTVMLSAAKGVPVTSRVYATDDSVSVAFWVARAVSARTGTVMCVTDDRVVDASSTSFHIDIPVTALR